jgi:hypothetical protein
LFISSSSLYLKEMMVGVLVAEIGHTRRETRKQACINLGSLHIPFSAGTPFGLTSKHMAYVHARLAPCTDPKCQAHSWTRLELLLRSQRVEICHLFYSSDKCLQAFICHFSCVVGMGLPPELIIEF